MLNQGALIKFFHLTCSQTENVQILDYVTKTIHPLLSHYSFTKLGEGRGVLILNFG